MLLEEGFAQYHRDMCRQLAAFGRDEQAAQDAVQQAFFKGLENRGKLEKMPPAAMKAWLFAAARNHLIDQVRKKARLVYDLQSDPPAPSDDPTDRLLAEQLLATLPEELAQVVRMRYYAGMDSTEIGQALGLPPPTVRARLRRALSLMKTSWEDV